MKKKINPKPFKWIVEWVLIGTGEVEAFTHEEALYKMLNGRPTEVEYRGFDSDYNQHSYSIKFLDDNFDYPKQAGFRVWLKGHAKKPDWDGN